MWRAIKLLTLAALAVVVLATGFIYLFGPHAQLAAAYAKYNAAQHAGDGATVVAMTAPRELEFFDVQRKHALHSKREDVQPLSFRQRLTVFGWRSQVNGGLLPLNILQIPDARDAYAELIAHAARTKSIKVAGAGILFAVPTGLRTARGYLDLIPEPGEPLQKIAMAVGFDAYYDFEKTDNGWLVDETPLQESSASENEYWALHMDPTGNALIFNMLGAKDPASEARLWEPLVR